MARSLLEKAHPHIKKAIEALNNLDQPLHKLVELDLSEVTLIVRRASNAVAEARVILAGKDDFIDAD